MNEDYELLEPDAGTRCPTCGCGTQTMGVLSSQTPNGDFTEYVCGCCGEEFPNPDIVWRN